MDQLIAVTRDTLEVERYRYDAFGRRTRISTSSELALGLANDGSDRTLDPVANDAGEATLLRRYTHSDRVDDPLQMEVVTNAGSDIYTYHSDHLGSIRALTDSAGNVSHAYDYDSYGQLTAEVEPTAEAAANPFRYTGREWDAASELYHYRARGYDASTGRFLQEDPIGFAAGDLNIYRYVGSNPNNLSDPSGTIAVTVVEAANRTMQLSEPIGALGKGINCQYGGIAAAIAATRVPRYQRSGNISVDFQTCSAEVIEEAAPIYLLFGDNPEDRKLAVKEGVKKLTKRLIFKFFRGGVPGKPGTTIYATATPAYPDGWRGR